MTTLSIKTTHRNEMLLVTNQIQQLVHESAVQSGFCIVFVPHTTAAITINENADNDVQRDFLYGLSKAVPNRNEFQHLEGNSDAHIKSSLVGVERTILIHNGELVLGRWQGIYFCEFDGPRTRSLIVKIFAE